MNTKRPKRTKVLEIPTKGGKTRTVTVEYIRWSTTYEADAGPSRAKRPKHKAVEQRKK